MHRVSEIKSNSEIKDCYVIPGELNNNDQYTRPLTFKDFISDSKYLKGSETLR